jgi:plastocyanin
MLTRLPRRDFIIVASAGFCGAVRQAFSQFSPDRPGEASAGVPTIRAFGSYGRGVYYFDPAGLFIEPGATVEWLGIGRRSVAAFHPANNNHELRIPEKAEPFDSAKMPAGGGNFRWKFEVEGTYDYFCQPQESLGMVGRIVVGRPGGPGEKTPGYGNAEGRAVMYRDSARLLEYVKSEEIVRRKSIPYPAEMFRRTFPSLTSDRP